MLSSQVCSIMNVMKFQTQVKQVLGTPDQGAWSQVHHFIPDQKEKFQKRGELVVLVSLGEIEEDQPTASVGREIISRFHEEYYGNLDKKPMAGLEEAAKKVAKEKSRYFDKPNEISLIGLVLWKNIAYLVIYHQGRILLRREGKNVQLLSSEGNTPVSASGFIQPNDIFVLGTTDFFEKLPGSMVSDGLSTEDLDRMVEIWGPVVHAREEQGRLGVAMVEIGPETDEPEFVQVEEKKEKTKKKDWKQIRKKLKFNFGFLREISQKISGLSVAIGFLVLLTVSIFFGWKKRRDQQQQLKITGLASQIDEKISNANSLRNLDPEESIDLINQAEEINDQLSQLDQPKSESYQQIMEEIKQNLGEKPLAPAMHYDMRLVSEDVEIESIYTNGQIALIFDNRGQRLISVNLERKSADILTGSKKLTDSGLVAFSNNRYYFISKNTIYWVKDENLVEILGLSQEFNPVAAGSWLGNLYLLDSNLEEIWQFPVINQGVGRERAWLKSKAGLEFSQLADMAIDGNIWILSQTGEVYKYLSGEREGFQMQLPAGIGKAKYLAVAQESERFTFWDSENKIIWLFTKEGEFIARQPVEVDEIRGVSISPDGSNVYLFGIDKIYLVEFTE